MSGCLWVQPMKKKPMNPLVCTTSFLKKKVSGSLKKVDYVCVETIFDGCSCVPNDLPYHSHVEGCVLCLSFFKKTSSSPSKLTRNRTIGRKEKKTHKLHR